MRLRAPTGTARRSPRVVHWEPLSEPEIRSRALQASLRHSGDVEQLVQRCKVSRALAKLDNPWRERSPNPWHRGKLGSIRLVDINGAARRRGRSMTPAVSAVPSNRAPMRRFALQRNVNFVAVVGACREIDRAGIRGRRQSAGQRDGLRVAVTEPQMIQARLFDCAGHVDNQLVLWNAGTHAVTTDPRSGPAGE